MTTTELIAQLESNPTTKEAAQRLRDLRAIIGWFEWCVSIENTYDSKCPLCGAKQSSGKHEPNCQMPLSVRFAELGDDDGGFASTLARSSPTG